MIYSEFKREVCWMSWTTMPVMTISNATEIGDCMLIWDAWRSRYARLGDAVGRLVGIDFRLVFHITNYSCFDGCTTFASMRMSVDTWNKRLFLLSDCYTTPGDGVATCTTPIQSVVNMVHYSVGIAM